MGLEYVIKCRCFRTGKFQGQPPHPEYMVKNERGEFVFEYPKYPYGPDFSYDIEIEYANDDWKDSICSHGTYLDGGFMWKVGRQMAIGFVLREFLWTEWDKYPMVSKYFPFQSFGDGVSLADAQAMIEELKDICQKKVKTVDLFQNSEPINFCRLNTVSVSPYFEDNTFSILGNLGFLILKSEESIYKKICDTDYGLDAKKIVESAPVVVLFQSINFERTVEGTNIIYANAAEIEKTHDFVCKVEYLSHFMGKELPVRGQFKVVFDEYNFNEYNEEYNFIISILERAIELNGDVEWC